MKDLSIVIVSWNVKDILRDCLTSIQKAGVNLDYEVFVVDNNSQDGSADMVLSEFPVMHLMQNTHNAGCSRAVNRAIKKASGKLILWLNPDMRLKEDTLKNLLDVADKNPQAGVIGARLENEEGEIVPHVRAFPTARNQFPVVSKLSKIFPSTLDAYLCRDFDYTKPAHVDSIRGSFFAMPRAVIEKIGALDERFFLWFEEVDFCKRAINAGYKVLYHPRIVAVDLVGQSFAQVGTTKKQIMFLSSMRKYFSKHGLW